MTDPEVVFAAAMVVVLLVIAFENTASAPTDLLFTSVTLPRAVLLPVTGTLGFVAGAVLYPTIRSRG